MNNYLLKDNSFFKKFNNETEEEISFVSQCLFAGSENVVCKNDNGWFYEDEKKYSKSWICGEALFNFLLKTKCGPFGRIVNASNVGTGDLIFFDFGGEKHCTIVTNVEKEEIFFAIKNDFLKEKTLTSLKKTNFKCVHILGVKK